MASLYNGDQVVRNNIVYEYKNGAWFGIQSTYLSNDSLPDPAHLPHGNVFVTYDFPDGEDWASYASTPSGDQQNLPAGLNPLRPGNTFRIPRTDDTRIITIPGGATKPIIQLPSDNSSNNLYTINVKTLFGIAPDLPFWVVEKLRNRLYKDGWAMSNITSTGEGYSIQAEKIGSVSVVLIIALIKAILALVGIAIVAYTIIRVVDSFETASEVQQSTSDILEYATAAGLTAEETAELLAASANVYKDVQDSNSQNGFFSGLNTSIGLGVIGLIALAALKK